MSLTIAGSVDNGSWRTLTISSVVAVGTLSNNDETYIAPEARCAAEFAAGESNPDVRGVTFQNGDCIISFGVSSFYQRGLLTACDFLGGASLRHATSDAAKALLSQSCQFEGGCHRFQSGVCMPASSRRGGTSASPRPA